MCVCNLWTSVTWKLLYKQTSVCLYCNEFAIFQLVLNFVQNTRRPRLPEIKGVHLLLVHFYLPVNWTATMKKSSVMVQLAIVGVLTNLVMNCLGHALEENQTVVCQVWHKSTAAQQWLVHILLKQQNVHVEWLTVSELANLFQVMVDWLPVHLKKTKKFSQSQCYVDTCQGYFYRKKLIMYMWNCRS